jgi:hypothetical protein
MTNYWAIAPWSNDERQIFDQVWSFDREHGTIAIRWDELGDLSRPTLAEIERRYLQVYGSSSKPAARMLWDFHNRIAFEDVVVARRGLNFAIGIGRVVRTAYFDRLKGKARLNGLASPYLGSRFIEVDWQELKTIPVSEPFTRNTLSDIGEAKYVRLFGRR